jgi:hypothetical protein
MRYLGILAIARVLCVLHGAFAGPPVVSYVTQPVRHWETFFLFGEGFDAKDAKVLRGVIADPRTPDELAAALVAGEKFRPPQTPPADVGDLYGRQYALGPQVIGGKLQGEVQVFWVRTSAGVSEPYVVNRPEVFFVEFDEVSPGQECRVFGRNMVQSFYPPKPRIFLLDRANKKVHACEWGNRFDYQGHLNYQLPYELRFKVPDNVPDGTYELWVHAGVNTGLHGFGGPVTLSVKRTQAAQRPLVRVEEHGAKGDGLTDDSPALELAVAAAAKAGGGTVLVRPGDYLLSRVLRVPPGVHLRGLRPTDCRLIVDPKRVPFNTALPKDQLPGKAGDWAASFRRLEGPPMVYLVSHSTVENLGLVVDEPVYWPIAAATPKGPIEAVAVRNCDMVNTHAPWITDKWRPGTGCVAFLGYAKNCEVRACRLRGMSGIDQPSTGYKCRTIDNRFSPIAGPFGTSGMGWMIGVHCVVEGNVCEDANRGFTCGPWFGPIEQNFIARNGVVNGGSVEGAGESFLFEGPDVGLETWFGKPSAAGPDWLEQKDQAWKPDAVKGRVALVVHGRGMGQWRRVTGNTEHRVQVDRPWSVAPNQDSLVVVRQFFMQNVLLNNYCRDVVGGIDFYGGALENTVERFVSQRAGAVWWYAAHVADPKQRMPFGPCWHNDARNCRFLESRGVALQAERRTDMPTAAPLLAGNRTQHCEFRHSPYATTSGMLLSLTQTSWLEPGDPRRGNPSPAIAYNALDSSQFLPYPGDRGIRLAPETAATLLWQLGWPTQEPQIEDRGTGTTVVPH